MGTNGQSPLCVKIIEAVATVEGAQPGDLEFTLHEHISTDAIEFLAEDDGEWELSFHVPDHEVTVMSDRTVLVDGEFVQ